MDIQQVTETMADEAVLPSEVAHDTCGSVPASELDMDKHDHKAYEEDVALSHALEIQSIPATSPMDDEQVTETLEDEVVFPSEDVADISGSEPASEADEDKPAALSHALEIQSIPVASRMDSQQIIETLAAEVVFPSKDIADTSGSEPASEANRDKHDQKSGEEDVAVSHSLEIQNIPTTSPMDDEQVAETLADEVVFPSKDIADISGSEPASEADRDKHVHKADEQDMARSHALEIQNIPVASPMRCGLAKRGLAAIYSSTVSAPRQHLSPTRGARNLASLLSSNNTMSGDDIVRLNEEAGPEAPELAKARARAARGRSAVAKMSALVTERRMQETKAAVHKQESPEDGRSSPNLRNGDPHSSIASKASREEKRTVEKTEKQAPASVDDPGSNERDNASAEHVVTVTLPTKHDEAQSPRTSKGSSKGSDSKATKRQSKSVKGNAGPVPAAKRAGDKAQEPPPKKPKMDPEVKRFLSLGEQKREEYMMSLSFTKQSKLAMKISLAEGL